MADPRLEGIARTVNELLLDKGIRHGIGLERLKNRIVRELVGFLNDDVFPDVVARLSAKLDRIASRGSDSGVWSTARYEALRDAIRDSIDEGSAAVRAMYLEELTGVAKMEAAWAANGIGEQVAKFGLDVTKPSVPLLRAIVSTEPFEGAVAKDWFEKFSADTQRGVIHAIDVGLAQGETVDQMVTRIRGTRAAGYADGVFQTSRNQAEMIVRTGVAHVTSRAREQTYSENSDIVDEIEISSALDHRVCERCAGLDGKTFKLGEGPRPPFHPNCLPGDSLVLSRHAITGASKRWIKTNLVVIRTASGRELSCTPNHPILTDRGFLAAELLQHGDHVVADADHEWKVPPVDVYEDHVPARIEDVARSFFGKHGALPVEVPLSPNDFHGDATHGEIAVVWSDGFLGNDVAAEPPQVCDELQLVGGDVLSTRISLHRCSSGRLGLLRARRSKHIRRKAPADGRFLGRRHSCRPRERLFALTARGDSVVSHNPSDRWTGASESTCNSFDAEPGIEQLRDLADWNMDSVRAAVWSDLNVPVSEDSENRLLADSELAADILSGASGPVFLDDVVYVARRRFEGHVFNLETERGFYVANGIVTHNCRCTTTPVTKSWRDLGLNLREIPEGTRASMNGEVPDSMTFPAWLKTQPIEVQNDVLGVRKAAKWRSGELSIDQFTNDRGRILTLEELAKL